MKDIEKGSHEQAVEVFAAIHRQALGNPRELSDETIAEEVVSLLIGGIDVLADLASSCDRDIIPTINRIKKAFPDDVKVDSLMTNILIFLMGAKDNWVQLSNIEDVLLIFIEGVTEQPKTAQS